MTSMDPPRLRTQQGLPGGLAAALQSSTSDDLMPGPEELRDLERAVLGAGVGLVAVTAATSGGHGGKLALATKLLAAKLGFWAVPAVIGASLGVGALAASHQLREAMSPESPHETATTGVKPGVPPRPLGETSNPPLDSLAPPGAAAEAPVAATVSIPPRAPREPVAVRGASPLRASAPDVAPPNQGTSPPIELAALGEVDLIERAHRAMANDPALAQSWLGEHERRFPDGTFAQEREAIAIEVMVRQGDVAGARARAMRFSVRFPGSTYAQHIESLLRTNGVHKD